MVEIKLTASLDMTQNHAHQSMDAAFLIIAQIQQLMSFHHADSQLSLLNRTALQQAVQVHSLVYAVLLRAQRVFWASQGLFDCTVADALVNWSLLPQPQQVIAITEPERVSQADVILLPNHQVYYNKPLLLDLGGIAKGFAVDMAVHTLRQYGIKQAVVNAGGDLRVLGHLPEQINIRSPRDSQQLISVGELSAGALATSGIYYSERPYQENTVTALVNPVDRQPIMTPHSFSVIAPTACMADALTKVVAITGDSDHPCLKQFGANAFIIH